MTAPSPAPPAAGPARRLLLPAAALLLVAGGGAAHGIFSGRWEPAAEGVVRDALAAVPLTIGDWDGTPLDPDPRTLPQSEDGAVLYRQYVNRTDGSAVLLYITGGRPGPLVSAHAPDSCYPGAGFATVTPAADRAIPGGPGDHPNTFRVATYSKAERASPVHIRVFWGYSVNGTWLVPNSRFVLAGERRCYKLYVIRRMLTPEESLDRDPAAAFLTRVIPQLKAALFPGR